MTTADENPTCEERITEHLTDRLTDIRHLWGSDHEDEGCKKCEDGSRWEYGLSFDYVSAGTYEKQREGHFRFQLSWGGPSDEFRFFADAAGTVHRIEYWFLHWFDGAHRVLTGSEFDTMADVFEDFREIGAVEKALTDATE